MFKLLLQELAMNRCPAFWSDRLFIAALGMGCVIWILLFVTVTPTFSRVEHSILQLIFFSVIWAPILEEIIFRGAIQGALLNLPRGQSTFLSLSYANWLSSTVFVLAHLFYQSWIWSLLVLPPSLVFGFFRDRYNSIYPGMLLHAIYNAGFLFINLIGN